MSRSIFKVSQTEFIVIVGGFLKLNKLIYCGKACDSCDRNMNKLYFCGISQKNYSSEKVWMNAIYCIWKRNYHQAIAVVYQNYNPLNYKWFIAFRVKTYDRSRRMNALLEEYDSWYSWHCKQTNSKPTLCTNVTMSKLYWILEISQYPGLNSRHCICLMTLSCEIWGEREMAEMNSTIVCCLI